MLEAHIIIRGDVQGVGFRTTTRSFAHQLNLIGFIRNKSDGTVEIRAQGEKKVLEQLITKLKDAFNGDYIDEMEIEFVKPEQTFEEFSITF
ncbi:MAG: Acylphosphatase [Chlamydiae bacterium]|nr:Acylphosphatase [Chlamydiota bacterium]